MRCVIPTSRGDGGHQVPMFGTTYLGGQYIRSRGSLMHIPKKIGRETVGIADEERFDSSTLSSEFLL
jgi:hypothetical protein